jgi:hypothetical protein
LESANKPDLGDFHALLTAAATAEEIVTWAKNSPAAAWALFFFNRDKYFVKV